MRLPSWEAIRSSELYRDITLLHAMEQSDEGPNGVRAAKAPQTIDDLKQIADLTRSGCPMAQEVDDFVGLIAADKEADSLVKLLPWEKEGDSGWLHLVIPGPDTFTDEVWNDYLESQDWSESHHD